MSPEHTARDHHGRVLVTGAAGFLGEAVASALAHAGHFVVRGTRNAPAAARADEAWVGYGDIGPETDWQQALEGVSTVVHIAGLAHLEDATAAAATQAFDRINAQGTAALAAAAARTGVTRFVLMSSALVHGEASPGRPFTEADAPAPQDAYARSKADAEAHLIAAAQGHAMQWVILRPPMVHGARARGNFQRLVRLVRSGLPLPLGAATAPRSFIGIDNLADATVCAVGHPNAADRAFLIADAEMTSTADLARRIARALGRPARVVHMPAPLLRVVFTAAGRAQDYRRLFAPLALDTSRIRNELGWSPPLSLDAGLARALS